MPDMPVDPVNTPIVTILRDHGRVALGLHANKQWFEDPRHLLFSMARYKFVAKMLSGSAHVLEIGCGDGFNARIVRQEVAMMTLVDIDPLFVADARDRCSPEWDYHTLVHDILDGPVPGTFDAVYSLDVLEHVPAARQDRFMAHAVRSLVPDGVMILGMPTRESQSLAKPASVTGHINCKTVPELKALMRRYFRNVFMFSMNDEIVHTGHSRLAHYGIVLGCGARAEALPEARAIE